MIAEVVALSRTYGIQTPYTSWLVTPEGRPNFPWQQGRRGGETPTLPPAARNLNGFRASASGGFGSVARGKRDAPGRGAGGFGGGWSGSTPISLDEAERGVIDANGRVATTIARKNAEMRQMRNRDGDRLDVSRLPVRKLGERWYHWIGGLLVDEDVNEKTTVVTVRFGSEAYFDLVAGRPDLRAALAAASEVLVLVATDTAVLVSNEKGLEQFSERHVEQFGLEPH